MPALQKFICRESIGNSMDNKKQIISILFADIENYSQIRDDDLYVKLKKFEEEFKFLVLLRKSCSD